MAATCVPPGFWITGEIETLTIDRCVLGPIRTTTPGAVETTTISNTTLQAIRTGDLGMIAADQVKDPTRLLRALQLGLDPVFAASAHARSVDRDPAGSAGEPASQRTAAPDHRRGGPAGQAQRPDRRRLAL